MARGRKYRRFRPGRKGYSTRRFGRMRKRRSFKLVSRGGIRL